MAYVVSQLLTIPKGTSFDDVTGGVLNAKYPGYFVHTSQTTPPTGVTPPDYFTLQPFPAAAANGSPLFTFGVPAGVSSATLIATPGSAFTYVIADAQPSAPPLDAIPVNCAVGAPTEYVRIALSGAENIYVFSESGTPQFIAGDISQDAAPTVVSSGGGGGGAAAPYPTASIAVASGAAATVAKSGAGMLFGILVSGVGSAQLNILDGPGGRVIAIVPANSPVGDVALFTSRPFTTSLYVASGANTPAVTLFT